MVTKRTKKYGNCHRNNLPHLKMAPRDASDQGTMDSTVLQAKGVKALVDSGIDSVPEVFILPQHLRPHPLEVVPADCGIPVIDLAELDGDRRLQTLTKIVEASQEWGFFQIVNHGLDPVVMENMMKSARDFHELPVEEKMKYITDDRQKSGYIPGIPDSIKNVTAGWMDQFYMFLESYGDWPSVCREVALEYWNGVRAVAERLLAALSEGLGMPADYLQKSLLIDQQLLALKYYPRCPNPSLTLGLRGHSDPTTLTILLQDNVSGLQVSKEGRWIAVEPLRNALVVNIGDQIEIVSNGRFKSVEHRAITNAREARMSLPTFFGPRLDAKISPILCPSSREQLQSSRYRECIYGDYVRYFHGKKLDGKSALDFVHLT